MTANNNAAITADLTSITNATQNFQADATALAVIAANPWENTADKLAIAAAAGIKGVDTGLDWNPFEQAVVGYFEHLETNDTIAIRKADASLTNLTHAIASFAPTHAAPTRTHEHHRDHHAITLAAPGHH